MSQEGELGFDLKIYTIIGAVLCILHMTIPLLILTGVVIVIEKNRATKKILLQLSSLSLIYWVAHLAMRSMFIFKLYKVSYVNVISQGVLEVVFLIIAIVVFVKILKDEVIRIPYIDDIIIEILDYCEANIKYDTKKENSKIVCNNCNEKLDKEDIFCKRCGFKVKTTCEHCKYELDPKDIFCSHCGTKK